MRSYERVQKANMCVVGAGTTLIRLAYGFSRPHGPPGHSGHAQTVFHQTSKINYSINMSSIEAALDDLKSQKKPLFRATARKYAIPYETL